MPGLDMAALREEAAQALAIMRLAQAELDLGSETGP
jgi:hypothetical protein